MGSEAGLLTTDGTGEDNKHQNVSRIKTKQGMRKKLMARKGKV